MGDNSPIEFSYIGIQVMSYTKAIRHSIRKSKKQANNHFGFSTLGKQERRKSPWLGRAWFEKGREQELANYLKEYHAETERMMKANPSLVLVD
tara:strand:+ start:298 stop:576 length:279 start_codon:yes stop_codon:yes gene_type:complete